MAGESDVPGIASIGNLGRWLADEARVPGQLSSVKLIEGGRSNLTYRLQAGAHRLVLRRPPLGHVLPTAHDMSREYRVLTALKGTAVPAPEPVAFCDDAEVIGVSFYLMRDVPGIVLRTADQASAALTAPQAATLSSRLAETLAAIHGVNIEAAGLADFGKGAGYLRRQLARWQRQWELSATREVAGYAELVARLQAGLAALPDGEATLVHGDFRLDNTIVAPPTSPAPYAVPRVEAVVDWEMATLGDPLADLGLTLTYWSNPGETGGALPVGQPTLAPGFMTREQFAARYAELTGRDVSRMGYYVAFGCFKLAVVLEGINARYLKHLTVGEGFEHEGAAVPLLIARAHAALDG
jgi:aminoglycoside phosphotransferase (APT) family kinase protein